MTRREIADTMNLGIEELHETRPGEVNITTKFVENDERLTDEICYSFVNEFANCGDAVESVIEVLSDYPDLNH